MAVGEPSRGRGEDGRCIESRAGVPFAPKDHEEETKERDAEESYGQSGREFGTETKQRGKAGHPIQQGRLFKPWRAPKPRGDPISGAGHGAADGSVPRLIRADQAHGIQPKKIEEEKGCGTGKRESKILAGSGCQPSV